MFLCAIFSSSFPFAASATFCSIKELPHLSENNSGRRWLGSSKYMQGSAGGDTCVGIYEYLALTDDRFKKGLVYARRPPPNWATEKQAGLRKDINCHIRELIFLCVLSKIMHQNLKPDLR